MTQLLWKTLVLSPIILGAIAVAAQASPVQTDDRPPISAPAGQGDAAIEHQPATSVDALTSDDSNTGTTLSDQVTSVSQLTDVKPTDWAFQALQSLVERYGCIVGYPDRTFRGNRALTRYEFAAGVNACLDRVNELIAAGTADLVKKEDLEALRKLQDEFAAELATLRGRVDALEARTATLEKQQFSTTTKLNAEVVVAAAGVLTGDQVDGNDVQKNTVLGDRVRLDFDTSFTGEDLLRTRLQATNLAPFSEQATFTPEGDFRFASGEGGTTAAGGSNNTVEIDALLYQFPLGKNTTVVLEANAGAVDDFTDTINPFLDGDGGTGALTHFGTRNPIYYLLDGAGIGIRQKFGESLELSLGYLASEPNDPAEGSGLFNGPYGAIAQLTFKPGERFSLGFTYIHTYNNDFSANGSTGSTRANFVSFASDAAGRDVPFSTNAFGIQASFQLASQIVINGSVGYTTARSLGTGVKGDADIWNWAVALAFPDLIKKGSVAGIVVGMEPKVTGVDGNLQSVLPDDPDTSLHVEAFYQFQLTDNIAITPGVVWLTAPNHDNDNDDIVIGTIRTTFTF